jgi:ligand-binding sensor domain-containing protein/AraC-like DNA-binding protein
MSRRNFLKPLLAMFLFYAWCNTFLTGMESIVFLQQEAWTVEEGLPMNTVMAITQTPDGYLWLGTEAGLVRFDGVRFKTFNHENTPEFSSDIIVSMATGRNGSLRIACRGGGVLLYDNKKFKALNEQSGLPDNDAWCVMVALDDSAWIGTKKGLNRLTNGKLTAVNLPRRVADAGVSRLLEDRNGRIWVGSRGGGLALVKKQGDDFENQYLGLDNQWITALFEDRKGAVWAGTQEKGLYKFQGNNPVRFDKSHGLSSNDVRGFYEDRFGNLWIATEGGGINILPAGQERFVMFPNQDELSGTSIACFFEDREGTLWVGTIGGGLNSLRETRIKTYSVKNGLSYHNVYGVYQDADGRIWCGTKGYGANYFQRRRFYSYTLQDGLSSDSVVTFAQDRDGGLWLGTLGGGVNRLKEEKFQVFNSTHGLSNNSTRSLYVDPEGIAWVGTIDGWIHRFEKGKFVKVANAKSRINMMLKDANGQLWAATFGSGLCRLDDRAIQSYGTKDGLSNNIVSSIVEDRDGGLWVGTVKGLNRFRNGTFTRLSQEDGLPDDVVYCILQDRAGDLWVSCNRGIYRLRRANLEDYLKGKTGQLKPLLFGKESGMLSLECNGGNQPCGWRARDGKLWFPTTNGVSVIDPMDLGVNKVPPPLVIEKILIDGISYPVHAEKGVVVREGGGDLAIHYTAPSFIVPKKIRFKYKLEPLDPDWIEAGSNRAARFPGIKPGRYRFRVIACNSDGVWNHTGASLEFYMKPEFYQTFAFKIIAIILLTVLAGVSFYYLKRLIFARKLKTRHAQGSGLDPEDARRYIQKLLYLLDVEELYKNPDLKINSLSSAMLISPRTLSRLINEHLNSNFYELINEYRIKESKRILSDPETKHESILDISYEVGYNSKSAFNRAFKNFTGLTPSQYRKKNKK